MVTTMLRAEAPSHIPSEHQRKQTFTWSRRFAEDTQESRCLVSLFPTHENLLTNSFWLLLSLGTLDIIYDSQMNKNLYLRCFKTLICFAVLPLVCKEPLDLSSQSVESRACQALCTDLYYYLMELQSDQSVIPKGFAFFMRPSCRWP